MVWRIKQVKKEIYFIIMFKLFLVLILVPISLIYLKIIWKSSLSLRRILDFKTDF